MSKDEDSADNGTEDTQDALAQPDVATEEDTYAVDVAHLGDTAVDADSVLPARLLDAVTLRVTVELGRIEIPFHRVRGMSQGAVLDLARALGDPLDVRVNGRLVARGEVVAIKGERYGLRLTEIVRHSDADGE